MIAPNRHRWDIDVVGHSWSPEIGQTLDALFAPKRAVHEQGMSISNFKCPNPSFNLGFCHRTVSHVLGITKAMRVKEEEESARGRKYDMVFLSRWDVLWQTPLLGGVQEKPAVVDLLQGQPGVAEEIIKDAGELKERWACSAS